MITSKTYEARYVPRANITPDGMLTEPAWEHANLETAFTFPWEQRSPPDTEFRAVYDTDALYFSFRVTDDDVVLAERFRTKMDVIVEDRVELFFARDERLAEYYCLEIDPLGRVLDYRASYHREFDFSWSFPELNAVGTLVPGGYTVAGRIPWAALQSLGFPPPSSHNAIKFGIYRAEFRHAQEGQREGQGSEEWISWVDPQTEEPDFHVPESFGYLKMAR